MANLAFLSPKKIGDQKNPLRGSGGQRSLKVCLKVLLSTADCELPTGVYNVFVLPLDHQVRLKAFDLLKQLQSIYGDNIPRPLLEKGFEFEGRKVPLIGPQGIFKPAILFQF